MLLRKESAGSAGIGPGYTWSRDGQIVEVPDHHGAVLLVIPDGGFSEVLPGVEENLDELLGLEPAEPEPGTDEPLTEPAPEAEAPVTEPAPEATPSRPRKATKAAAKPKE